MGLGRKCSFGTVAGVVLSDEIRASRYLFLPGQGPALGRAGAGREPSGCPLLVRSGRLNEPIDMHPLRA